MNCRSAGCEYDCGPGHTQDGLLSSNSERMEYVRGVEGGEWVVRYCVVRQSSVDVVWADGLWCGV